MPEKLAQRVISVIAATQKMPPEKISIDSTFEELGIDSLDGVNILFALENEFNINIPDDAVQEVRGVRQMVESLERFLASGAASAGAPAQA
jgi:acyl carrier protein